MNSKHRHRDPSKSVMTMNLTLEGPCIIFCNMYTFQRDTQCCNTDCLLMHRCQLYIFRTVMVHPQELLFRCCTCRLWYVVRTALSDTSRWYNVWGRTASINNQCCNSVYLVGMYIYCNYRFLTATMVERTCIIVTLYAHCLSWYTFCGLWNVNM